MKTLKLHVVVFITLILSSCGFDNGGWSQGWSLTGIKGEGPKVTKELNLTDFDAISLSISGKVYLSQGPTQSVKIEAQQNIIDNLKTDVNGGKWKITFDQNVRNHSGINIWITLPGLTEVAISGSGDIIGETLFTGLDHLNTSISGSGNIKMEAEANSVAATISGSGDIDLSGKCKNFEVRISGSGSVDAQELFSHDGEVKISGSGNAHINADQNLGVTISGSGDVFHSGGGKLRAKVSGSGDVIQK